MVMVSQTGSVGFIAFLVCSVLVGSVISLEPSSEVQIEALKAFKNSITNDPFGALLDWNDTNLHHCNWSGIACDTSSNQVISVSFPDKQLKGEISPFLGNISTLQILDLSLNSLTGHIPPQLGLCSQLLELSFYSNSLSGSIPPELGNLRNVQSIDLGNNILNGSIPESICNCTALLELGIIFNNLTEFAYMRKVTTKVDVFSFGIIVMELLTKRRPTGLTQEDGLSITLPQLVERALANGINRLLHVVDPLLASQVSKEQEMVEALLKLALSCTCTAPEDRPDMDEILSSILKLSKHRIASKQ